MAIRDEATAQALLQGLRQEWVRSPTPYPQPPPFVAPPPPAPGTGGLPPPVGVPYPTIVVEPPIVVTPPIIVIPPVAPPPTVIVLPAPAVVLPPAPSPVPVPGPGAVPVPAEVLLSSTTVNFHFTGQISGGPAASELRAYGPVGNAFRIRQLVVYGAAGITAGQFLDVVLSTDANPADVAVPSGSSIMPLILNVGALPAPDADRGLPWVSGILRVPGVWLENRLGITIKVRSYFLAPAVALAVGHVVMVVDQLLVNMPAPTSRVGPPVPAPQVAPGGWTNQVPVTPSLLAVYGTGTVFGGPVPVNGAGNQIYAGGKVVATYTYQDGAYSQVQLVQ